MPNPMSTKIEGVGEGYPISVLGTSHQRSPQRRRKLYFHAEIHYGRVILSGLTS
jgi:hypothetical protein